MTLQPRHPFVIVLVGIVTLFQYGCALKRVGSPSLEEVRGRLGVVGVASPSGTSKVGLNAPSSGRGAAAAKGAAAGAFVGAQPGFAIVGGISGCSGGGAIGAVICGTVALFGLGVAAAGGTLGALGGALSGAANTETPSKEVEEVLQNTVTQLNLQETLRESVLQAAIRQTSLTFVPLPIGPAPQSADAKPDDAGRATVDTLLEVALQNIKLTREGSTAGLPVALVVSAQARLIRAADGRELYRHSVTQRSASWPYAEWATDDARHLREALANASTAMTEEIIDVLFVRSKPPRPEPPSPPPAQVTASPPQVRWTGARTTEQAAKELHCQRLYLEWRSDWRDRLPEYRACLAQ